MNWLTLANALVAGLEQVIPLVVKAAKSGEISLEEQKALSERIGKLRTDEAFQGPEWEA